MTKKITKEIGQRTIIGFDFGKKYIGVAVGQEITGSASPLGSVKATDGIPHWDSLSVFLTEWQPDLVVVGLPLNMDGSEQQLTKDARKFGNRLAGRFGLKVEFQDERLTTADAKEQLFARGGFKNLKKDNIDAESARLIIESFFEQSYQ
ncbi:Holliday junction resolvase RuvX [Colwellia sp. 1_MG-2023]|jgi:putative Holliday junction resolvase|uniref:Holliday junction resolvase RuvX n=1 Tax=unclassified Colwellia TaxID=196834 RepID=UPI00135CE2C9|nr:MULTISPECIES: Holliday junction resolvase RuvX [unclassified Colwellia]MBU2923121.1 Holliday junction resolvase RuvX [Colwellia sp. C2M11]MDO6488292.1 Holliday junction resolvase RuvX [Colwellia sp. 6_MG-2023]MDO6651450.1 Holliday junction resolvase RuvX [Colwellia sp. 3_MG-2023]MDO6664127.1 Holliday junction resolvase RuvX [Colwellia sp. 2_MG-2023]MDO6688759.1 Holliday junction resolvase RuvX [Colwellia sp. 1_MG-2023]